MALKTRLQTHHSNAEEERLPKAIIRNCASKRSLSVHVLQEDKLSSSRVSATMKIVLTESDECEGVEALVLLV